MGYPSPNSELYYKAIEVSETIQTLIVLGQLNSNDGVALEWPGFLKLSTLDESATSTTFTDGLYKNAFLHLIPFDDDSDYRFAELFVFTYAELHHTIETNGAFSLALMQFTSEIDR